MAIKYHLPGWSMPTRRFGAGMRRAPQRVIWAGRQRRARRQESLGENRAWSRLPHSFGHDARP
jgi:hypothetical protein